MSAISCLPSDALQASSSWLAPADFYHARTVWSILDQTTYWRGTLPTLPYAIRNHCPALVREIVETSLPDHSAIEHAASDAPIKLIDILWRYYNRMWPGRTPVLLGVFATANNFAAFSTFANPTSVDWDELYGYNRWNMIAWAAARAPVQAARWIFGNPDARIIADASRELPRRLPALILRIFDAAALSAADRSWYATASTPAADLGIIDALWQWSARPGCVYPNNTVRYKDAAMQSPHACYLEYLTVKGLPIETQMIATADTFEKQRIVWMATVEQKFVRIVLLIAILVIAAVLNISCRSASPLHKKIRVGLVYGN